VKRKLLALLLGLLTTLVALELGIRVGYRSFVRAQARANLSELQPGDDAIRVLCMGESTTAVAADPEGRLLVTSSSYPAQLQEILSQRPTTHRYEVLNIGMMGGSSGSSLALLEDTLPALKPQVIVAMMGIKDTPSERLPGLGALPGWLAALRTVQLALRAAPGRPAPGPAGVGARGAAPGAVLLVHRPARAGRAAAEPGHRRARPRLPPAGPCAGERGQARRGPGDPRAGDDPAPGRCVLPPGHGAPADGGW
jgi:hypothetical protein